MFSSIQSAIAEWLSNLIAGAITGMLEGLETAIRARWLGEEPWVVNALEATTYIAAALLPVIVAWQAVKLWLLRERGEPADIGAFIRRVIMAGFWVAGGPWVVRFVYQFAALVLDGVSQLSVDTTTLRLQVAQVFSPDSFGMYTPAAWGGLILGAIIWGAFLALYLLQSGVRTMEIAFLLITAPIFGCFVVIDDEGGAWKTWTRELITVTMSQSISLLIAYGGMSMALAKGIGNFGDMLIGAGALWLSSKAPSVLRQYTYSSGFGSSAAGTASGIVKAVINKKVLARVK